MTRPQGPTPAGPPSRWLVLRVARPASEDAAALLADVLLEAGGRAVLEEGTDLVSHVPEPGDVPSFLHGLRHSLAAAARAADRPAPELRTSWQAQEDWAEVWKRGLEPRRVTPRLVVTPSWCAYGPEPGDLVITLDPGMAFGNAEHGTTRGCLRLLDGVVRGGDRILDVGAGSAILSIAAALLGASEVLGLEADPLAVPTARDNVETNGVADRVRIEMREVDAAWVRRAGPRDGVVANIETGILRRLLPGLVPATAEGGWLLLSGILADEWAALAGEVEASGPGLVAVDADGDWRSGLFRRQVTAERR